MEVEEGMARIRRAQCLRLASIWLGRNVRKPSQNQEHCKRKKTCTDMFEIPYA
jgi:hypothetical protein